MKEAKSSHLGADRNVIMAIETMSKLWKGTQLSDGSVELCSGGKQWDDSCSSVVSSQETCSISNHRISEGQFEDADVADQHLDCHLGIFPAWIHSESSAEHADHRRPAQSIKIETSDCVDESSNSGEDVKCNGSIKKPRDKTPNTVLQKVKWCLEAC